MLMRYRGKDWSLRRWVGDKPVAKLLAAAAVLSVSYALIVTVFVLVDDDAEAPPPWQEGNLDAGEFFLGLGIIIPIFLGAGFAAARINVAREMRLAEARLKGAPRQAQPKASAYTLGIRWSLSGRRLWTFGVLVYAPIVPVLWLTLTEEEGEPLIGSMPWWDRSSLIDYWVVAHTLFWMTYGFVLKGREVRRGKERIKVADEYLAIREQRLHAEFDMLCEKLLESQQAWKAEKTKELYEQILDQQARGLLPCPNCHGRQHGGHKKSA